MPEAHKESIPTTPNPPPGAGALFRLLTKGNGAPEEVYTAMREVETMAGQSVVAQLTALIQTTASEQTAQFQAALAEQNSQFQGRIGNVEVRLDSVEKQMGRMWTVLVLILGTLLGTLTTVVTTLLLRT